MFRTWWRNKESKEETAGASKEESEGGREIRTYFVVVKEPFVVDLGERLHVHLGVKPRVRLLDDQIHDWAWIRPSAVLVLLLHPPATG